MRPEIIRGDKYQGTLAVGQRVYSILSGGRDGIICRISGEQSPETIRSLGGGAVVMGGRATMDIVFEESVSRQIPECIVRGVQWFISEEIASGDEILTALTQAAMAQTEKAEKENKEAEEKAADKAGLPGRYPYLIPVTQAGSRSTHALGAANIKTELKRAFPGVKFSIRSKSFSGGDSIHVDWTDGPITEEVEKVTGKYQEGSFDGMEDIYNYNHSAFPYVFGGAKYVQESRHLSAALVGKVAAEMGFKLAPESFDKWGNIGTTAGLTYEQEMAIYREARTRPGLV
uniref:Large polyvalent protein associated domain-containing protein n=1 Tax=viral metagenome TaxID=1070528 RepID=A0A6M3KXQ4_9ZZZZ